MHSTCILALEVFSFDLNLRVDGGAARTLAVTAKTRYTTQLSYVRTYYTRRASTSNKRRAIQGTKSFTTMVPLVAPVQSNKKMDEKNKWFTFRALIK